MSLMSLDEALDRIAALLLPARQITVSTAEAAGHVVASPVRSRLEKPPFDASAMDGYAIRAADLSTTDTLDVIGTAPAGGHFAGVLAPESAVRIFTGAPMPEGADTVVMQEATERDGARVRILEAPQPGANIRPRGSDFSAGAHLLAPGHLLTPGALSLVASANVHDLEVWRKPDIGILATGDELVPIGTTPGPGQIVSSNSLGLAALLAPYAGRVTDHGIAPDDRDRLSARLEEALAAEPDVLVTIGGASVGEHDFVRDVLIGNGVEIDFWRIAMRPGKPMMFGRRGRTLVFGLPGNPVSSLVTARVLVLPALARLQHLPPPSALRLRLLGALPSNGVRRLFLRGRRLEDGVEPILEMDSANLSSIATADCLIVQPENDPGMDTGALVSVLPFAPKP